MYICSFTNSYICVVLTKLASKIPYILMQLHVFKPVTSKSGNSEQYVICIGYKGTAVLTQEHLKKMSRVHGNNAKYMYMLTRRSGGSEQARQTAVRVLCIHM